MAEIHVTPLVRRLAAEYGVALASVRATGVGGRIRKDDVIRAAADMGRALRAAGVVASGAPGEFDHLFPPPPMDPTVPPEFRDLFPPAEW